MQLTQPINYPVSERGYKLYEPYTYIWAHNGIRYKITVPKGFEYDGASVPRICWSLTGIRPDGLIRAAATIHDFLYEHQGQLPAESFLSTTKFMGSEMKPVNKTWSRKQSDQLFARLLREKGVSKIRRRLAYIAVRVFGGFAWRS